MAEVEFASTALAGAKRSNSVKTAALQVELFRQVLLHVVGFGTASSSPLVDADAGQDDIRRLVQQARVVEIVEPGPDDAERLFGLGL